MAGPCGLDWICRFATSYEQETAWIHARGRQKSFACSAVNNWNRLPFSVVSVKVQHKFKQKLDTYVCLSICLLILFSTHYVRFWALCPSPISKYIRTYIPISKLTDQKSYVLPNFPINYQSLMTARIS